jgi:hypothetical protein
LQVTGSRARQVAQIADLSVCLPVHSLDAHLYLFCQAQAIKATIFLVNTIAA